MEDDKDIQRAIARLACTTEHWLEIKKILLEEIRQTQVIIVTIDKIVQDRADKYSKLN